MVHLFIISSFCVDHFLSKCFDSLAGLAGQLQDVVGGLRAIRGDDRGGRLRGRRAQPELEPASVGGGQEGHHQEVEGQRGIPRLHLG